MKQDKTINVKWISIQVTAPPLGIPVWLWNKEWVDEDFNPTGIIFHYYNYELHAAKLGDK